MSYRKRQIYLPFTIAASGGCERARKEISRFAARARRGVNVQNEIRFLIILLLQALPVDALATIGKALTDEELDRAYALTGLAKGDGLYHNGMMPNDSMSGVQLAHRLEDRLDTQLHNIDDVLARARYQLDELKELYPTVYTIFTQSPFYS